MSLDYSPGCVAYRFLWQRYVIVTEGDKIASVAVEPVPSQVTITAADKILPLL